MYYKASKSVLFINLIFGHIVFFGLLVFYLFGHSVINSVIWFSNYSVLWIRSNGSARFALFKL